MGYALWARASRETEKQMSHSETALEKLLLRLVSGTRESWEGAPDSEIEQLEAIAGRALPSFYRWFLSQMGRSMGPLSYPTVDFTAQGILGVYATARMAPDPRYLLIGYEHDELTPLHYFYDLDDEAREDALVVRMLTPADETHDQFETFREMLAWGELWTRRVEPAPQQCRGTLRGGADLQARLEPVLRRLGFDVPIETGPSCGLYEREDAVFLCTGTPHDTPGKQTFGLGGRDAPRLAQILGEIASESSIDVSLSGWTPPLPAAG
jgi:hypothetical protein